jgi:hypothetical protein
MKAGKRSQSEPGKAVKEKREDRVPREGLR